MVVVYDKVLPNWTLVNSSHTTKKLKLKSLIFLCQNNCIQSVRAFPNRPRIAVRNQCCYCINIFLIENEGTDETTLLAMNIIIRTQEQLNK